MSRNAAEPWQDASANLSGPCPAWPTSIGVSATRGRDIARGDSVTETHLTMDVHCGTHVDAPAHVFADGATVDELPVEAFVGPVVVIDATGRASITGADIEALVPAGTARVLFRTDNSARGLMRQEEFEPGFVALSADGAQALAARPEIVLIGNDYLSIQLFGGDDETHRALLRRGIAAIEGLDLTDIEPGSYELVAIPLRIDNAEAAPLRAMLKASESTAHQALDKDGDSE